MNTVSSTHWFLRLPLHHLAGPLYVLFYAIQHLVVTPLEQALIGPGALTASLLFLPAGIKVVTFYLCRWQSVPSLIVGGLVCSYWFYLPGQPLVPILVVSVGSALALPILYEVACRFFDIDLFKGWSGSPHWLALLSLVGLSGVLNGWALSYAWDSGVSPEFLARVATGDILGVWVLMLAAMFVLRHLRLRA